MPTIGPSLDAPVELPGLLRQGLDARPDDVAMVSLETRWTWRDADAASDRYAAGLAELDVTDVAGGSGLTCIAVIEPMPDSGKVPSMPGPIEASLTFD